MAGFDQRPPPRGVPDGFDECYADSFASLTRQIYMYSGDLNLAQDVVQEAFCRAYTRWSKVVTYDDPVAWVRRVAFNLANSRWQRAKVAARYVARQRERHVEGPGPDRVAVIAVLGKLPARQRKAIVMHYLADIAVADIAHEEGVPVNTVKTWLHRGRAALAVLLAEGGTDNV
ncbi:SigE family RNA polymerase sigma factor [Actinoplanes sp. TBRC 11911]|uniref:SigE family RNA polymerase sigma factor n=1 Tax=Actinoplanes sp. TBRC 11911 TaxID=2729386 RepID=UPI0028A28A7E|nr:SigE family RNA polymerase sigma factor [Actinoplanes sp. TBRC 11911]